MYCGLADVESRSVFKKESDLHIRHFGCRNQPHLVFLSVTSIFLVPFERVVLQLLFKRDLCTEFLMQKYNRHAVEIGSYTVTAVQRISKDTELRGQKGKYHEQNGNETQDPKRQLGKSAGKIIFEKESSLIKIGSSSRNKEDRDVDPIGRCPDHAVIGVEQNRNEKKSE